MKKNLNLLKILAVAILFLILGCRQEADWTTNQQQQNRAQEFFKNNIKNSKSEDISLISNAIEHLEKINTKNNFLSKISDKKGLPVWEYLIHADVKAHQTSNKGDETSEILIIPLRQEENFLSSLLYVENLDSDNPDIYTVTNEQLEDFVHNQQVDKTIRESVLMTFLSFDRQIFGDRKYSSIPLELFDKVHVHNGDDFKSFNISEPLESNPNAREIMDCFKIYHCTGCQGACDGCNLCVSDYCYLTGSGVPGSTGSSGSTGTSGNDGSSGSTTGGGNNTGGSGSNTPEENIPWYLANPNIYNYNGNVRIIFRLLYNFNIVLNDEQLNLLQDNVDLNTYIRNYLSNNTVEKSKMVEWVTNYLNFNESYKNYYCNNVYDLAFLLELDSQNIDYNKNTADVMSDLLVNNENNTLHNLDTSWPNWNNTKSSMKERFKNSIPIAVKYGKILFTNLKKVTDKYPATLIYANKGIDKMRNEIHNEGLINYDIHTMKWKDIVGCWLFELGNFSINNSTGLGNMPTLGFAGFDYTISGIPNDSNMRHLTTHKVNTNGTPSPNSIMDLRKQAITRIKEGKLNPFNGEWIFGTDATINTITKLDGMQFCLGSYQTDVYITSLGNNKYELTYIVKNKTGWTSGSRGLNDYNGNPTDDSIIPDKPRGTGLHLGGTIGETFGWKEIIIIP